MNKYDTVLPRIGASIIDSLLMIPVVFLILFIAAFLESYMPKARFFAVSLPGIISALYVVLMHTFYGQTLGKMATKVKVVDDSERPIIFGQAVLRSLPQIAYVIFIFTFSGRNSLEEGTASADLILLFWVLYFLFQIVDIGLFMINDKHRSLHDFIAKTVVIRTDV